MPGGSLTLASSSKEPPTDTPLPVVGLEDSWPGICRTVQHFGHSFQYISHLLVRSVISRSSAASYSTTRCGLYLAGFRDGQQCLLSRGYVFSRSRHACPLQFASYVPFKDEFQHSHLQEAILLVVLCPFVCQQLSFIKATTKRPAEWCSCSVDNPDSRATNDCSRIPAITVL